MRATTVKPAVSPAVRGEGGPVALAWALHGDAVELRANENKNGDPSGVDVVHNWHRVSKPVHLPVDGTTGSMWAAVLQSDAVVLGAHEIIDLAEVGVVHDGHGSGSVSTRRSPGLNGGGAALLVFAWQCSARESEANTKD